MSACSSPINFGPSLPAGHFLTFLKALPQRHALRRQPLKQGAGSLHIRGRETFGEPIINRCKRCSRLVVATLAHPQTGNAEGDPQLPEQSALLAGHLGRLVKAIFGRQGEIDPPLAGAELRL